jgi:hypothetical protein
MPCTGMGKPTVQGLAAAPGPQPCCSCDSELMCFQLTSAEMLNSCYEIPEALAGAP